MTYFTKIKYELAVVEQNGNFASFHGLKNCLKIVKVNQKLTNDEVNDMTVAN